MHMLMRLQVVECIVEWSCENNASNTSPRYSIRYININIYIYNINIIGTYFYYIGTYITLNYIYHDILPIRMRRTTT